MPGGGQKPGHKRGSRRGKLNKRTIEEAKQAEIEQRRYDGEAHLKLPKDILFEFSNSLAAMAAYYQPTPEGMPQQNAHGSEDKFEKYARLTLDFAKAASPFFSPIYKALAVQVTAGNENPGGPPLLEQTKDGKIVRIGGFTEAERIYEQMTKLGRKAG